MANPKVYRAPGRVNLIGEHTDYNDGFVLPAALELATYAAIAPRDDRTLRIHSLLMDETVDFDLDEAEPKPRKHWSDYVRGVAVVLERAGHRLAGADMVLGSDVPLGAGLSSSAALEVATGYALLTNSRPPGRSRLDSPLPASAPRTSSSACAAASWTSSSPATAPPATRCCSTAAASSGSWCRSTPRRGW